MLINEAFWVHMALGVSGLAAIRLSISGSCNLVDVTFGQAFVFPGVFDTSDHFVFLPLRDWLFTDEVFLYQLLYSCLTVWIHRSLSFRGLIGHFAGGSGKY